MVNENLYSFISSAYLRAADMVKERQIMQWSAANAVAVGTSAKATELRGFI
ncbi:MAG: hypothetical protein OTJ98_02720 [Dehalococcoidia bacterium]|nr:hypothetical protein [Dehalococcoidia bacterium]